MKKIFLIISLLCLFSCDDLYHNAINKIKNPVFAVYVSKKGSDLNKGGAGDPVLTVTKGVELAEAAITRGDTVQVELRIAVGTYEEASTVEITKPVSLSGGWNEDFTEQGSEKSEIVNRNPNNPNYYTLLYSNLSGPVSLSKLKVVMDGNVAAMTTRVVGFKTIGSNSEIVMDDCVLNTINATNYMLINVSTSNSSITIKKSQFLMCKTSSNMTGLNLSNVTAPVKVESSTFNLNESLGGGLLKMFYLSNVANIDISDNNFSISGTGGIVRIIESTGSVKKSYKFNNNDVEVSGCTDVYSINYSNTGSLIDTYEIRNNNFNIQNIADDNICIQITDNANVVISNNNISLSSKLNSNNLTYGLYFKQSTATDIINADVYQNSIFLSTTNSGTVYGMNFDSICGKVKCYSNKITGDPSSQANYVQAIYVVRTDNDAGQYYLFLNNIIDTLYTGQTISCGLYLKNPGKTYVLNNMIFSGKLSEPDSGKGESVHIDYTTSNNALYGTLIYNNIILSRQYQNAGASHTNLLYSVNTSNHPFVYNNLFSPYNATANGSSYYFYWNGSNVQYDWMTTNASSYFSNNVYSWKASDYLESSYKFTGGPKVSIQASGTVINQEGGEVSNSLDFNLNPRTLPAYSIGPFEYD